MSKELSQELKSKKLGNMPIGKLILTMSGPAILSMLVQALYNIVDSIFIGMYDPINGVTALSYAMPMQLLVNAFGIGLAVGTGSMISRLLGEGRNEDASLTAQTGLFLALVMSAVFAICGYFISRAFICLYAKNDPVVYEMASNYLTICTCCSFGMMLEIMFNRIIQSMGNMIIPMITQIV
ncbi:MAG: MATE family efflux transporter, partial [Clostridia bacterium]|nr:MATE family efflux transporter [Clostridia bacterium]